MDVCCHLLYIRVTNKMSVSNVESKIVHCWNCSHGPAEWTGKTNGAILPLTGLKKLKKESCGTSLVMVLTVPLPLCFCFFLMVFTVTSLPFCQSILQLDTNQAKLMSHCQFPACKHIQWRQCKPASHYFFLCNMMVLLTPHSPRSLAPRMRKGLLNLAPISFCMF